MILSKIHDRKEDTVSPLVNDPIYNELLHVGIKWANQNLKIKSENLINLVTELMRWIQLHKQMKSKGHLKKKLVLEVVKTIVKRNLTSMSESEKRSVLFFVDMLLPQTIETIIDSSKGLLNLKKKVFKWCC